jgi:hypothetical protein
MIYIYLMSITTFLMEAYACCILKVFIPFVNHTLSLILTIMYIYALCKIVGIHFCLV